MARAVSTPTANLPFQFIPVRPRFPVWPSRFRKRQRFYTFVPLHGANFQSSEPYRRSEHLTPLAILQERLLQLLAMFRLELRSPPGQIKRINGHLPFGIDQSDLDVALLIRQARRDPVE